MGIITFAFLLSAAVTIVSYAIFGLLWIVNDILCLHPGLLVFWKNENRAELVIKLKDWMGTFVAFSALVTAIMLVVFLCVSYHAAFPWQP